MHPEEQNCQLLSVKMLLQLQTLESNDDNADDDVDDVDDVDDDNDADDDADADNDDDDVVMQLLTRHSNSKPFLLNEEALPY